MNLSDHVFSCKMWSTDVNLAILDDASHFSRALMQGVEPRYLSLCINHESIHINRGEVAVIIDTFDISKELENRIEESGVVPFEVTNELLEYVKLLLSVDQL